MARASHCDCGDTSSILVTHPITSKHCLPKQTNYNVLMDKFGFWTTFAVVFFAEAPCIVRTIALQLQNQGIASVVWGTLAGSGLALVVGIILAKICTKSSLLGTDYLSYVSGFAIILVGIWVLLKGH